MQEIVGADLDTPIHVGGSKAVSPGDRTPVDVSPRNDALGKLTKIGAKDMSSKLLKNAASVDNMALATVNSPKQPLILTSSNPTTGGKGSGDHSNSRKNLAEPVQSFRPQALVIFEP